MTETLDSDVKGVRRDPATDPCRPYPTTQKDPLYPEGITKRNPNPEGFREEL